ncbi:hypothetical protein [Streptomyces coeruleorubidus]|uniref:FXSXX-COOH protein n=1 Tax=Streptomyces coeruleorubidus TaxID=116188 RepID=A0ABZ0KCG4_STRC4|nr:hypothetical protein [Streptomyces coeruleorubidus]WOT35664.1 hypothetical protein R5U08_16660 [Streptomyces coeruleorubidus]
MTADALDRYSAPGPFTRFDAGRSGLLDDDLLIDTLADTCAGDDPAALARLFADPHFAVPGHLTG